jgi:hypothetical protein
VTWAYTPAPWHPPMSEGECPRHGGWWRQRRRGRTAGHGSGRRRSAPARHLGSGPGPGRGGQPDTAAPSAPSPASRGASPRWRLPGSPSTRCHPSPPPAWSRRHQRGRGVAGRRSARHRSHRWRVVRRAGGARRRPRTHVRARARDATHDRRRHAPARRRHAVEPRAGGDTAAQAVAQLARAAPGVATSVALQVDATAPVSVALAAVLGAGAAEWIGLRVHPEACVTLTFDGPQPPPSLLTALRDAVLPSTGA